MELRSAGRHRKAAIPTWVMEDMQQTGATMSGSPSTIGSVRYIEQLTPTIVWILIGCAYRPLASAILGFLYFIGRVVFTVGYSKSSNKRILGALIIDVAFLGLFILSIITIGKWGQFD